MDQEESGRAGFGRQSKIAAQFDRPKASSLNPSAGQCSTTSRRLLVRAKKAVLSIAALLAVSSLATAQTPNFGFSLNRNNLADNNNEGGTYRPVGTIQKGPGYSSPFSRIAIGGVFGTQGPGIQITTNLA